MIGTIPAFTAEAALERRGGVYATAAHAGAATLRPASATCRCKNFQPGCGCLAFCHRKTGRAVAMCNDHMAKNAACKQPGVLCYGCQLVPHSDHAEYYICR